MTIAVRTTGQLLAAAIQHHQSGRTKSGDQTIRSVLANNPTDVQAWRIWAALLQQAGDQQRALRLVWRAFLIAPADESVQQALTTLQVNAYNAIVVGYREQAFAAMADAARGFVAIGSEAILPAVLEKVPPMLNNAAQVAQSHGRWELAMDCAETAVRLAPSLSGPMLQRAYLHLIRKNYRAAWNPADWRRGFCSDPTVWDGQRRAKDLLVYNTNGFGDFIQFMRFLPVALKRVENLHLMVPRRMRAILEGSPALDGVHLIVDRPTVNWDASCDIVALPFAMGLAPATAGVPAPYLIPPREPAMHWRALLDTGEELRIGLVWARSGSDRQSIGLAALSRLFTVPGVHFFGLQNNGAKSELFGFELPDAFTDLGLFDWSHLAAVMANLDVVITPDCGMAHLAGALGVPTWVVLQRYSEWRWGWEGDGSDWYPSVRVFRQDEEGDWPSAVAKVEAALRERAAHTRSGAPSEQARLQICR